MYLCDYHLHSTGSPDGTMTIPEIAAVAVERGLQEICITDHLDTIYWQTYAPRDSFDWAASLKQLSQAREQYGSQLEIRLGAELGEATIAFDRAEKLLSDAPDLDFVIGSVHTAGEKFHFMDYYYLEKRDEAYYQAVMDDYLDETVKLVRWGKFQVLGHPTLPLRYIKNNAGLTLSFDDRMDRLEEIFSLIIPKGIGLELNINRGDFPLPSPAILRRYREMGGEIVTIGSDAHDPRYIGVQVRECQELLRQCGFTHFAAYRRGNPVFHPL